MNNYNIRNANKNDLDDLTELARKTISHNFRSFMGDEAVDGFITSGMSDKEIIDGIDSTIVIENDNEIIGLCIWKDSLLHLLMIDPSYQGSGVSKFFMDSMEEAKLKEYDKIYLECFDMNDRAIKFYNKQGWKFYKSEVDPGMGWVRNYFCKSK